MKITETESLGSLIKKWLKRNRFDGNLNEARIKEVWKEMFDIKVQKYTRLIKFSNGVLKIFLDSASLRHEFQLRKTIVLNDINKKLNEEIVKDIIFL